MEVRLLEKGYKMNEGLYEDFLEDKININDDYFSKEIVHIRQSPDFPIYMGKGSEEEKKSLFLQAFNEISQSYLNLDREILLDERFWHSLLLTQKRDYILKHYPQVKEGSSRFHNIVLKKFDWENYIYKSILGAQYINDNTSNEDEKFRYYELIIENLDLYNYIIKYEIFRNDKFLINILDIIDELKLSKLLKAKIKGREDLGDDERYGRRVIFEFNKSYPVVMAPMLDKEELKKQFVTYLSYYFDVSQVVSDEDMSNLEIGIKESITTVHEKVSQESNLLSSTDLSYRNNNSTISGEERFDEQVRPYVLAKEINKQVEEINKDELLTYLKKCELEIIDHRGKGGSLWVIGDKRIEPYLKPLEDEGIYFRFKPIGGRASKYRPAWFWYV